MLQPLLQQELQHDFMRISMLRSIFSAESVVLKGP